MPISAEDRSRLVALARAVVEAEVKDSPLPPVPAPQGVLTERRGCFVTLTNRGHLRGCIGTFQPQEPLALAVMEMAAAAARDPRFVNRPITADELPQLRVEVSVLSPLVETDKPLDLEVGRHGIYVIRGPYAGCFLPEVATDMGWSAEEFLNQCCVSKAGLATGAWRQSGTRVYLFTSEKFDR